MPDGTFFALSLQIKSFPLGKIDTDKVRTRHNWNWLLGAVHCMSLSEADSMAWLTSNERVFLRAVSHLGDSNPFLPERITYEREALGADFVEAEVVLSMRVDNLDAPLTNNTALWCTLKPAATKKRHAAYSSTDARSRARLTAWECSCLGIFSPPCRIFSRESYGLLSPSQGLYRWALRWQR
jgi:hypothetical protein